MGLKSQKISYMLTLEDKRLPPDKTKGVIFTHSTRLGDVLSDSYSKNESWFSYTLEELRDKLLSQGVMIVQVDKCDYKRVEDKCKALNILIKYDYIEPNYNRGFKEVQR